MGGRGADDEQSGRTWPSPGVRELLPGKLASELSREGLGALGRWRGTWKNMPGRENRRAGKHPQLNI